MTDDEISVTTQNIGCAALGAGWSDCLKRSNIKPVTFGVFDQNPFDCDLLSLLARGIEDSYSEQLVALLAQGFGGCRL